MASQRESSGSAGGSNLSQMDFTDFVAMVRKIDEVENLQDDDYVDVINRLFEYLVKSCEETTLFKFVIHT